MATENGGRDSEYPKNTSLDVTKAREKRLEEAGDVLGESTRTGAIDQAARHARTHHRNLTVALEELEEETRRELERRVELLPTGLFDVEVEVDVELVEPGD